MLRRRRGDDAACVRWPLPGRPARPPRRLRRAQPWPVMSTMAPGWSLRHWSRRPASRRRGSPSWMASRCRPAWPGRRARACRRGARFQAPGPRVRRGRSPRRRGDGRNGKSSGKPRPEVGQRRAAWVQNSHSIHRGSSRLSMAVAMAVPCVFHGRPGSTPARVPSAGPPAVPGRQNACVDHPAERPRHGRSGHRRHGADRRRGGARHLRDPFTRAAPSSRRTPAPGSRRTARATCVRSPPTRTAPSTSGSTATSDGLPALGGDVGCTSARVTPGASASQSLTAALRRAPKAKPSRSPPATWSRSPPPPRRPAGSTAASW